MNAVGEVRAGHECIIRHRTFVVVRVQRQRVTAESVEAKKRSWEGSYVTGVRSLWSA